MSRKIPEIPFVIAGLAIAYFYPFLTGWLSLVWKGVGYLGVGWILAFLYILSKRYSSKITIPLLWALIIHIYSIAAFVLDLILPFSFMGITYLAVTLALIIMIKVLPAWQSEREYLRLGKIDGISVLLIAIVSIFSGIALILWVRLLQPDLEAFLEMMPKVSIPLLMLAGLGFAVTNAFVEEMFFRGFLWRGIETTKYFSAAGGSIRYKTGRILQLLVTALFFGLLHFNGFPGGAVGIGMVFVWGIFLGILRKRTGGMLAPFLAHVASDMTIFGILCGLYL